MRTYRRVTLMDRIAIKQGITAGLLQKTIADNLGLSPSTISREIFRNTGKKGYRPKQADRFASRRQEFRMKPRKLDAKMKVTLRRLLRKKWSPEQISKRLEFEGKPTISYESIYQWVYQERKKGGSLWTNLRRAHRKRRPRYPRESRKRGHIPDMTPIEKRGKGAGNRSRRGHWERDTMIGSKSGPSVLVLVDRKSRLVAAAKMKDRKASRVKEITETLLKNLKTLSITNDRGKEFSEHKELSKSLKVPVYFCNPYSSFERGSNENRIGIIRQYLAKGKELRWLKHQSVEKIIFEINHRPMKCLDWKTPYEVFFNEKIALTS